MAIQTRKLTGDIAWGITLIAGGPDCGKTVAAYMASNSDLVNRTFLLAYGEDIHEDYLPIAPKLEVVEHDGSTQDFMSMLREAVAEPRGEDGKPNLIVIDGGGNFWGAISGQAQYAARLRQARKEKKYGNGDGVVREKGDVGLDEATIHPDLWNAAADRWADMMDVLREHDGPVVMTTVLREVTVMDDQGRPTKKKQWVIDGHRTLRGKVQSMICIPAYREFYVVRVKTLRMEPLPGDLGRAFTPDNQWTDGEFSIDAFWKALGMRAEAGTVTHAPSERQPSVDAGLTGDDVKNEVRARLEAANQRTRGNYNPIGVIRAFIAEVTEPVLAGVRVETNEGPINARDYLEKLIAHYRAQGCPDPAEDAHAPTERAPQSAHASQGDARANVPNDAHAPSEPARDDARTEDPREVERALGQPHGVREEDAQTHARDEQEHAPEQKRAADAQQAADSHRADTADRIHHLQLVNELEGQAAALGVSGPEHLRPILVGQQGAQHPDDLPDGALRAFIVAQRPTVIAAMRAAGRASEADAYSRVPANQFAWWEDLTGAGEDAREPETANA